MKERTMIWEFILGMNEKEGGSGGRHGFARTNRKKG